jgi:hypothetical protein
VLTDTLKKALRDEAQALNEFAAGQKSLQVLIGRRQWTRLQSQIDELKTLASRVEALEDSRVKSYRELKSSVELDRSGERRRSGKVAGGGSHPPDSPELERSHRDTDPGRAEAEPRESARFEELLTRLPPEDRDELFGLYRQLKLAVIRVKGNAGLLGFYLRSLSGTVQKVLEELFPHRRGTIYSRSGKSRDAGEDSMVVHRHI